MTKAGSSSLPRRAVLAAAAAAFAPLAAVAGEPPAGPKKGRSGMNERKFDRARFVADCVLANVDGQAAVREVLVRAVRDHAAVLEAMGEPASAGLDVLHRSATLTIFAAKWAPNMNLLAHDHRMWALIGIYTGREDNIFWRRTPGRIEAAGAKALFAGDVATLGAEAIHSVANPLQRFTGGIHIYGGDFFATSRSQWDPETMAEGPSDGAVIEAIFARENERIRRCAGPVTESGQTAP